MVHKFQFQVNKTWYHLKLDDRWDDMYVNIAELKEKDSDDWVWSQWGPFIEDHKMKWKIFDTRINAFSQQGKDIVDNLIARTYKLMVFA